MGELEITIPERARFYHLYAEGKFDREIFDEETGETHFYYGDRARVLLYYTYPAHRRVYLIQNDDAGAVSLPGLSRKVSVIFKHCASGVDKTRRALAYLSTRYPEAFSFSDAFFNRLSLLISQKGKLNYAALACLLDKEIGGTGKTKRRKSQRN
jgi:hypothetical protein